MKISLVISILLLLPFVAFSQNFEGLIVYDDIYESHDPEFSSQEVTDAMGSRREYYISNSSYKSVTNGSYAEYQVYSSKENRLYNKIIPSDTLYWVHGKTIRHPIINFRTLEQTVKVLGFSCNVFEIETTDGTTTYYFSKKFKVDPNLFKEHYLGSWFFYLNQSGALPLKTVVKNSRFTWTSTAVLFKEQKLNEDFFQISSDALKMQIN